MTSPDPSQQKPASSANHYSAEDHTDSPDWFLRILGVILVVGGFVVLIHMLQLVTAMVRTAQREHLFGGFKGFAATILIAAGGVILATVFLRGCVALFGAIVAGAIERRRLRLSTERARRSIDRKKELLEERIRLAAQLRATWMF